MAYVIACLMAGLSFLLNRALLKHIGNITVISMSPAVEEMSKTLLAYYLDADIFATHVTFGLLEAVYDWYNGTKDSGKAAALSIAGHSLFGVLTLVVLKLAGSIWPALGAGLATHLAWNVTMIRLIREDRK